MKLAQAVSRLMGNLQRSLFPCLEECWQGPLTEKEKQLVSILLMHRRAVRNLFSSRTFRFSGGETPSAGTGC